MMRGEKREGRREKGEGEAGRKIGRENENRAGRGARWLTGERWVKSAHLWERENCCEFECREKCARDKNFERSLLSSPLSLYTFPFSLLPSPFLLFPSHFSLHTSLKESHRTASFRGSLVRAVCGVLRWQRRCHFPRARVASVREAAFAVPYRTSAGQASHR